MHVMSAAAAAAAQQQQQQSSLKQRSVLSGPPPPLASALLLRSMYTSRIRENCDVKYYYPPLPYHGMVGHVYTLALHSRSRPPHSPRVCAGVCTRACTNPGARVYRRGCARQFCVCVHADSQSAALVIHQAGDVHRLWAGVGLRTRESPTVWSALSRRPLPPRCHSTPCRLASPVGAPQRVTVCVCLCVCNARRYLPRYPRSPHTLLPPCTPRHCPGWVQRRKPPAATDEHLATRGLRAYSQTR